MIWSRAANRPRTEETQPTFSLERELLARVGAKDVEAFEKLYRMYQPRLAQFLGTVLQRSQLVEEVLDDTMMTVWQARSELQGGEQAIDLDLRDCLPQGAEGAGQRWPDPVQDDEFDMRVDPGARADERLQHHSVSPCAACARWQQLSLEHRAVVDLTYFHGLGYREIAEIVGCPVETVKTRDVPCAAAASDRDVGHFHGLDLESEQWLTRSTPAQPHDEAEELLPWYATGQLEAVQRERVEAHLAECADCQATTRYRAAGLSNRFRGPSPRRSNRGGTGLRESLPEERAQADPSKDVIQGFR